MRLMLQPTTISRSISSASASSAAAHDAITDSVAAAASPTKPSRLATCTAAEPTGVTAASTPLRALVRVLVHHARSEDL